MTEVLTIFFVAYGMVFVAELVGDKAIYTIGTLATRYGPLPVFAGIVAAFMGKMLAAVLIGQTIATLPRIFLAGISALTFFMLALLFWFRKTEAKPTDYGGPKHWYSPSFTAFGAIFFSEWGDVGQIAAATVAAQYRAPLTVWAAATMAMTTKGMLAIALGVGLRRHLSQTLLRRVALCLYVVMGIASLASIGLST
jgi:putative Ca2+/H+ antiporter (TMEM165/GDT1 family)